uniref:Uncharacterized protein n=1 Tax=viral metagenome TaxID=1070528 RepID=A0A6M3L7F2_9ZZZZ
MEIIHIRQRLEELPDEIEKAELTYVEAKATLEYMENMKRHVLAYLKEKQEGSNPERESKALASQEYKNHLTGIMESARQTGAFGAQYHKLQNEFEAMRSLNKNIGA